ncbi:hypothetical protein [Echinicola arenosa]|uniref:hypothetical protein n=1 Tax=Echinicola arenosa TaxID=2774144 RepID=UPI00177F7F40|nr:hypothetical protein [Echinicola arenosa]
MSIKPFTNKARISKILAKSNIPTTDISPLGVDGMLRLLIRNTRLENNLSKCRRLPEMRASGGLAVRSFISGLTFLLLFVSKTKSKYTGYVVAHAMF